MDRQLRILRIIHAAFLIAAMLYVWLAEVLVRGSTREISPAVYSLFAVMAAGAVATIFILRPRTLDRGAEMLQANPDNATGIKHWQTGYFCMFACSEVVVLYGFLVRFMGGSLAKAAPFYAVGIVLLLLFYPRRP